MEVKERALNVGLAVIFCDQASSYDQERDLRKLYRELTLGNDRFLNYSLKTRSRSWSRATRAAYGSLISSPVPRTATSEALDKARIFTQSGSTLNSARAPVADISGSPFFMYLSVQSHVIT